MQRQQTGRKAWMVLALLAAAGFLTWAQGGDTPIVIMDGSLTINSAVEWDRYTGAGDVRTHPHTTKSVTKVVVTMPGKNQTVNFNGEQCIVDVMYAGTDIKVATGRNGKGLTFSPFSAFLTNATSRKLIAHKNQTSHISHVTVTKAGAKAFESDASGGTTVTISYQ